MAEDKIRLGGMALIDGVLVFFFSSRRRHTRLQGDWSSDVCSSDLTVCPTTRNEVGSGRGANRADTVRAWLPPALEGDFHSAFGSSVLEEFVAAHKIGRASCRERV